MKERAMREPSWLRKHLILSSLTFACILIDAAFFVGLGSALRWLAGATSPFVLAGLALVAVLAVRVFLSVRSARLHQFVDYSPSG